LTSRAPKGTFRYGWLVVRGIVQVFRACLVASAFFWFWTGGVVLAWTLCPILILAYRDETRRWRICQRIVKRAYRAFHRYMEVLTLVELRVVGDRAARPPGPMVIVANHPTLVDVTAILSTYDDVCCIVKETLMKNIFVGLLLRTCGHVAAADGEGIAGVGALDAVSKRLQAGMAVLFFPEGTRSPPLGLRAFRRGAFEVAVRAHVPIWPMLVTCDPPALSKGLPIWKHPERVARLRIEPAELMVPPSNGRSICRETEALFRGRLFGDVLAPVADESKGRYPASAVMP
jgi:1-acyl-sn-glycerol-3-phosphate acyltransferase